MIPLSAWLASFAFLAFVTAFICTAVKEDSDRKLIVKTLGFFLVIAGGTAAFCAGVLAIEKFF